MKIKTNVDDSVGKQSPQSLLVGRLTVAAAQEISVDISPKPKGGITMQYYTVLILDIYSQSNSAFPYHSIWTRLDVHPQMNI